MSRLLVACICFCALAASAVANDEGYDEATIRGNDYIDRLLRDMFVNDNDKYDPYAMEDSVVGFSKKVMFLNVSGEAKLHDGTIKGLKTLHRPNDCSLHNGERLTVKADLGAGVLDFHYSGSAKFMNFGPTITVEGTLAYIEVHIEFTVDAKTGKNGKLTKFIIDDMRGMKVWVTGLGPINWAVNPIISAVTKIFQSFLRNFLQNKVKNHLEDHIPNYQFPVEGDGETEAPLTEPPKPETTPSEPETSEETQETQEPETPAPEETQETQKPETPAPEETQETQKPETPAPEQPEQPEVP